MKRGLSVRINTPTTPIVFASESTPGYKQNKLKEMDSAGFEPAASSLRRKRSSDLIYEPDEVGVRDRNDFRRKSVRVYEPLH